MSDGIQLSSELISDLITTVARHDNDADADRMVLLQYLMAVSGILVADYPGPDSERSEILAQLSALMNHVCDDRVTARQQTPQQAPSQTTTATGKSVATDDPAVGIWKPE